MAKKKVVVKEVVEETVLTDGGYTGLPLDNGDVDFTRSDI